MEVHLRLGADFSGLELAVGSEGDGEFTIGEVEVWVVPDIGWVEDDGGVSPDHRGYVRIEARTNVQVDGAVAEQLQHLWTAQTVDDRAWAEARERRPWDDLFQPIPPGQFEWAKGPGGEVVDLFLALRLELDAALNRVIGLLRWRHRINELQRPPGRLEWSLDQTNERWLNGEISRFLPVEFEDWWIEESECAEIDEALSAGKGEPLAHEILAEAMSLRSASPRAALVLAATAAELGTRMFASGSQAISESWLLHQPGTPPVDALLAKYVPMLTDVRARDGKSAIPRDLRKRVREVMEARNSVLHHGAAAPDPDKLAEHLRVIGDLLYLLDWLGDEAWAIQCVSEEWRAHYRTEPHGQS